MRKSTRGRRLFSPQKSSHRRKATDGATEGEWDALREDPELLSAYQQLARSLEQATHAGGTLQNRPDIKAAVQLLDENPMLVRYLSTAQERAEAMRFARERTDDLSTFAAPSGSRSPQSAYNEANMGGWSGETNKPIGVPNPRSLRAWADQSTWVGIAKGKLRRWVERADVAVVPDDEERPYSRTLLHKIDDLLNQPNEFRDSYRSLIGPVVEDILVLDRGVIEKNMTLNRVPVNLYYQDGATIKIYPLWSGDPKEPRYLYDPGGQGTFKRALRNDEAIVIMANISTWRLGYSPVQMLQDTIRADIEATQSAIQVVKMKPPPHIVQIPNASPRQLDIVRARYDAEFAGRKELMFMGGPAAMNVKALVYSLRDQQWMEWNIYLARKIATIFGISPQEFGLTMDINRANAETQADMSENTGYIPLLLLLEEYLNREFIFDYAPRLKNDRVNSKLLNLRLIFPDVSEVARMLHVDKVIKVASTSLAGLPSMTLNMVLAMFGEAPVPGGDVFYVKTAAGAVPWLGYATGNGNLSSSVTGGQLGGQNPESGPDDTGGEGPNFGEGQGANSGAASASGGAEEAPGGTTETSGDAAMKRFSWYDGRRPGRDWTPSTARRAGRGPSYNTLLETARRLERMGAREREKEDNVG